MNDRTYRVEHSELRALIVTGYLSSSSDAGGAAELTDKGRAAGLEVTR